MKLREPARSIWQKHRHAVEPLRGEAGGAGRLMLGGGSILGTRWEHRRSTDIDVLMPDREALNDAHPDGPNDFPAATGGEVSEVWKDRVNDQEDRLHQDLGRLLPDRSAHSEPAGRCVAAGHPGLVEDAGAQVRPLYVRSDGAGGRRRDQAARAKRLEALANIPLLPITDEVGPLATALVRGGILPEKALNDALHVAGAAAHRIDYRLTWNYRHLDNAETKPAIRDTCVRHGLSSPEICTPWELMGDREDAG